MGSCCATTLYHQTIHPRCSQILLQITGLPSTTGDCGPHEPTLPHDMLTPPSMASSTKNSADVKASRTKRPLDHWTQQKRTSSSEWHIIAWYHDNLEELVIVNWGFAYPRSPIWFYQHKMINTRMTSFTGRTKSQPLWLYLCPFGQLCHFQEWLWACHHSILHHAQ
jgi:hypothetical protein